MTDQLNIVLHLEDEPYLVIESNINLLPRDAELYAQVWKLPDEDELKIDPYKRNHCLRSYRGNTALTDAVLYLSDLLGQPVAHKLRRVTP